jgi:L-threonylcarbamoyladenylate synthase
MDTRILRVMPGSGLAKPEPGDEDGGGRKHLEKWVIPDMDQADLAALHQAAQQLRSTDVPVAFPTETVYGLGADATRGSAVRGIFAAKGRPSDNPLIVHVSDLAMLRRILRPAAEASLPATRLDAGMEPTGSNGQPVEVQDDDPLPVVYRPLIDRFWPGPLTILLRNPRPSTLAPEVSAGLPTFGARMPASVLARSLIHLAGTPLAAPSANASTRPSPTTAQHVADDLGGRIALVLDGGPCSVGVESTVVDGLCEPPVVLRPGGVSLDELRQCRGWEGVQKAYKDGAEVGKAAPRAPGMKYKHYSPKARVVLYEASAGPVDLSESLSDAVRRDRPANTNGHTGPADGARVIGIVRTARWPAPKRLRHGIAADASSLQVGPQADQNRSVEETETTEEFEVLEGDMGDFGVSGAGRVRLLDVHLGPDSKGVAQRLFSVLREMDRRGGEVIIIEGLLDADDIAGAVMNRLRKAASEIR